MIRTFVVAVLFNSPTAAADFMCYPLREFEDVCRDKYNGVADGGRCFFVGGVVSNWSQAWDACAKNGSVLAQFRTGLETQKVTSFLQSTGINMQWGMIALLDTNHSTGWREPSFQQNTTFWYHNEHEFKPIMNTGITWIRTRVYDDWNYNEPVQAPRCFSFYQAFHLIGDAPCWVVGLALCQVTTASGNYTKTNYCLTEIPMDEFYTTGPMHCATMCSRQSWCRSFNYIVNNGCYKCQLFSWSIYDECELCAKKIQATNSCYHYNYVP